MISFKPCCGFLLRYSCRQSPVDSDKIFYTHPVITNSDHLTYVVLFFPPPPSPPPLLTLLVLLLLPQPSPYPPSFSCPMCGNAYIHADGRNIVIPDGFCWKFT